MVNLILKFKLNPKAKEKGQLIAFHQKKIHFIVKDSDKKPKPGEYWECFLWHQGPKFNLVKPFRKIEENELQQEQMKVDFFNKSLEVLEKIKNENKDDFEKITFDEKNKPWLISKLKLSDAKKKYKGYVVKEKNKKILIRPVLTSEDKKEAES